MIRQIPVAPTSVVVIPIAADSLRLGFEMKCGLKRLLKPAAVLAFLQLMAAFAAADETTTKAVSAAVSQLLAPTDSAPGHWVAIGPSRVHAPASPGWPAAPGFGPYDAVGRLTTIAVHPKNPQIIYVGSAGQLGHEGCGVWKTTNGGQTWVPISDSLPTLSIGAIAIDPTKPDRIYIVTADEGLYRSDTAGLSWAHVYGDLKIRTNTTPGVSDRTVLLINPKKPNVLYVTSDDGVLHSTDYGKSWQKSLEAGSASSLVMDPSNPEVLYAAIVGKGVYKTDNGGTTPTPTASPSAAPTATPTGWTLQTQGISYTNMSSATILLALTHPSSATSEIVYALLPNTSGAFDLFRTSDGKKWSKRYTSSSTSYVVIGVDPIDWKTVYLGGPFFWISSDGGDNFTQIPASQNDRQPASPHGDYWELVVDPINPAVLYAGSDGGIYRSTDHGKEGTWEFIGQGIANVEMYDLALANTWTSRAISGTQDNGTILYHGTLVWEHIPSSGPQVDIMGNDGAAVAIEATNQDQFYAVRDNRGTPNVSSDCGETFVDFSTGLSTSKKCAIWNMTSHIEIHPVDSQILLEPCQSLWRTQTAVPPGKWVSIFTPTGQQVVRSSVDPKLDVYYAGTNGGRVYAGPSGSGWQEVFANTDSLYVSDIEVDHAHADTVYVSFAPPTTVDRDCKANAGTHRIYQLKRQSPTLPSLSMSASDITSNLPFGLCVNALAIDPHVPRTLYAATNKGVYRGRRNATGRSWVWESYNDGMPPADVRDLEVHPVSGNIFAATFGRSAFKVAPERPSSQ
jgi:hypothetical protein